MMAVHAQNTILSSSDKLEPDMVLINDLYEEIENRPPAIEARRLLVQQCLAAGWEDAAREAVKGILGLLPADDEATAWAMALKLDITESTSKVDALETPFIKTYKDTEMAKYEMMQGYEKLKADSARLRLEVAQIRKIAELREDLVIPKTCTDRLESCWAGLHKVSEGRISTVLRTQHLRSTRSVAADMVMTPAKAVHIAIADLEEFATWLRSPSQLSTTDDDILREALVKRVDVLTAALPEKLKYQAKIAFMHVEHETLQRKYVNDETMYGDEIKDIPRDNFLVTDDGYAWDMEELAQAITSGGGVMRNPLSKQMFTSTDTRAIVQHRLGSKLQALQVEQGKLSKGVRPKTIEEMETLADVLLSDMSDDQLASRQVVDAFLAYVATLPDHEQKALDALRVPAKDSHTGQAYDCTISEAVRDAQGNRVCFHKTGDFIKQAANYLKKIDQSS